MAVEKLPAVTGGCTGAECLGSLQQRHSQAATRELGGRGDADDAAADDHDSRHLPLRPGGGAVDRSALRQHRLLLRIMIEVTRCRPAVEDRIGTAGPRPAWYAMPL